MKKTSTILLVLSFLFALAAIVIAIVGTISLKRQTAQIAEEVREELAETAPETETENGLDATTLAQIFGEGCEPNDVTEEFDVPLEELGFTFSIPESEGWGVFNLQLNPGVCKGSGSYGGSFTEKHIVYFSTIPTFVPGRGGYVGDMQGYRKTADGYEVNFLNQSWIPVPEHLTQGEIDLKTGKALIVSLEKTEEPMPFSGEVGSRAAILNIPNGPVSGGVFLANPDVTRDEFRKLLSTIEFLPAPAEAPVENETGAESAE